MGTILHVCTANVIRSPMAELVTRWALPPDCTVSSAGLQARPGQPIWPQAATLLRRHGIDSEAFSSRRLTPELAAAADLVLTATRRQRDTILAGQPYLMGRVFTWRELAWLTAGLAPSDVPGLSPAERIRALPAAVAPRRGYLQAPPGAAFDVRDPVDGPPIAFERALDQIGEALASVLTVLLPRAAQPRAS